MLNGKLHTTLLDSIDWRAVWENDGVFVWDSLILTIKYNTIQTSDGSCSYRNEDYIRFRHGYTLCWRKNVLVYQYGKYFVVLMFKVKQMLWQWQGANWAIITRFICIRQKSSFTWLHEILLHLASEFAVCSSYIMSERENF